MTMIAQVLNRKFMLEQLDDIRTQLREDVGRGREQWLPVAARKGLRFFAVLHQPPVTSPVEAVRAAIVAEHGNGKR